MKSDLEIKDTCCTQVAEGWAEFQQSIEECHAHLAGCLKRLDSADEEGVPLTDRCEEYQVGVGIYRVKTFLWLHICICIEVHRCWEDSKFAYISVTR